MSFLNLSVGYRTKVHPLTPSPSQSSFFTQKHIKTLSSSKKAHDLGDTTVVRDTIGTKSKGTQIPVTPVLKASLFLFVMEIIGNKAKARKAVVFFKEGQSKLKQEIKLPWGTVLQEPGTFRFKNVWVSKALTCENQVHTGYNSQTQVNASAISINLSQKAKQNVVLLCLYSPTVRELGKKGTKYFYGRRDYTGIFSSTFILQCTKAKRTAPGASLCFAL